MGKWRNGGLEKWMDEKMSNWREEVENEKKDQ